ncbi:hypothetical protein NDU88_003040 [Pleurodeles waltl]|uniref:Uncharacterized protein n=1 Tax=Pleurodeles waltl TaxID=8319 RepID=A0AAV7SEB0_PLEWA|nr:hypothetical protein NDU88_003040 [Pleurodeles waltl]
MKWLWGPSLAELSAPASRSAPAARRRAERCAGEGRDRQRAQESDRLRGAPFIPKPRGLPRRRQAPMRLEVAAPRPLSGRLAAMPIPLELLLRDALGRRLPTYVAPSDQQCAPGWGVFAPPSTTRPTRIRRPSLYAARPRPRVRASSHALICAYMSDLNVEKEGSHEDLIHRIVSEEAKTVVQECKRQALGKRKGIDEEEFYSLSEGEDRLRGPGVAGGSKSKGTLSDAMESQLDTEKEDCSGDFMIEDDDKYVLDLEYKDNLEDDFGTVFRANSGEELLNPLGAKLFEPKDIRHPRVSKVEAHASSFQDRDQALLFLRSKLMDLEDRSRRDNVRFIGFPENMEGEDLHRFLRDTLPRLTGTTFEPPLEFQRAHRLGPQRTGTDACPKPIIACLLRHTQARQLIRRARTQCPFQLDGHTIQMSADFSKETSDRCRAFLALRPRLRQLEVKYGLFEPARTGVTKNGTSKYFYDPEDLEDLHSFLDGLSLTDSSTSTPH